MFDEQYVSSQRFQWAVHLFFLLQYFEQGFRSQTGTAGASENFFDGIPGSSVKRPQELFQEAFKMFIVPCFSQPIIPVQDSAGS